MLQPSAPLRLAHSESDRLPHGLAPQRHRSAGMDTQLAAAMEMHVARYFTALGPELPAPGLYDRLLATLERPLIIATLRTTGGNQIKAAEILGLNRNTLRKKMRDLAIDAKSLMRKDAA